MKIQRHSDGWILSTDVVFRTQTLPCRMCGEQSGNWDRYFPYTSVSPLSIVPQMLHIPSFIYHRCYIILLTGIVLK
jgi:hypothetical protein